MRPQSSMDGLSTTESFVTFGEWLICEGGNAVDGVTRINQENVAATVQSIQSNLLPLLRLTKNDIRVIGSTGKKNPGGSSGDIDIAISLTAMAESGTFSNITFDSSQATIIEVVHRIGEILKKKYDRVFEMPGIGIVSVAYPIANTDKKQPGEFVQVDLMITDDLDYTAFAYWGPGEAESKYKGLYRNIALFSIAGEVNRKVLTKCTDADGCEIPETWSRYWFDMNRGLMKGIQSIKGTKGLLKNPKAISKDTVTRVPIEIVKFLLGGTFDLSDVNSFETIYKAVMSGAFAHKQHRGAIIKAMKDSCIKNGFPLPDELT